MRRLLYYFIASAACVLVAPVLSRAQTPTPASILRSVDLERENQERERRLEERRMFYFDRTVWDIPVDEAQKKELDGLVAAFRRKFLTPAEVQHLCALVKGFLREKGYALQGVSLGITGSVFRVGPEAGPSGL